MDKKLYIAGFAGATTMCRGLLAARHATRKTIIGNTGGGGVSYISYFVSLNLHVDRQHRLMRNAIPSFKNNVKLA
jgi:hypothetical protein